MEPSKVFFTALFIFLFQFSHAQKAYYFVSFKNKDTCLITKDFLSERSIKRRLRHKIPLQFNDYPVSSFYKATIYSNKEVELVYTSKWLNGALVLCDVKVADWFKKQIFVSSVYWVSNFEKPKYFKNALLQTPLDYGNSYSQIHFMEVDIMHEQGLNGKGVYVALFDGGFQNVDNLNSLSNLFKEFRVKYTYNIVDKIKNVFFRSLHGTNVLSCLGAYSVGNMIGTGYGADFALFITEDVTSEKRIEEYNWLRAAEMADSLGVDIISSSLGYNTFDNSSENHSLSELDGRTTIITKAAQIAAQKGILVINSAGNNYNESNWRNIVFPCDADSILAVGSVDANGEKASFSAVGPANDGRIKPDIVSLGVGLVVNNTSSIFSTVSGTSYSAPLVTGLAAGLWQSDSTLTNIELINYIKLSSSMYFSPNNQLGYGIPRFSIANRMIKNRNYGRDELFPNPVQDILFLKLSDISISLYSTYQIVDLQGNLVLEGDLSGIDPQKPSIDLSNLVSGFYFLQINSNKYKLIKM